MCKSQAAVVAHSSSIYIAGRQVADNIHTLTYREALLRRYGGLWVAAGDTSRGWNVGKDVYKPPPMPRPFGPHVTGQK